MTQTDFFNMLGAPLTNPRWSWGGVRPEDGTVFLKVWKDQMRTDDGAIFAQITYHSRFQGRRDNFRHRARIEQVNQVRGGARCYLVECEAADPTVRPSRIRWFNTAEVFPGGRIVELDGDCWIEMLPPVPVQDVMPSTVGSPG